MTQTFAIVEEGKVRSMTPEEVDEASSKDEPADSKTGWPAPALAQDDSRPLFRWFASRLDARRIIRAALGSHQGKGEPGEN